MFGKRKIEKPKNPLGLVLYEYDNIINKELKDVLKSINKNKKLNPSRTGRIFDSVSYRLNSFKDGITKDKLKTDYRSDKARDLIIDMLNTINNSFEKIKSENFDLQSPVLNNIYSNFEYAFNLREAIRKKLKDVECDYS
ncbi:MAG: hypothetical protein PHR39_05390 [Actinomycetota bacterium]|nr:hypothetical protein [Actinomycetota bacterium]